MASASFLQKIDFSKNVLGLDSWACNLSWALCHHKASCVPSLLYACVCAINYGTRAGPFKGWVANLEVAPFLQKNDLAKTRFCNKRDGPGFMGRQHFPGPMPPQGQCRACSCVSVCVCAKIPGTRAGPFKRLGGCFVCAPFFAKNDFAKTVPGPDPRACNSSRALCGQSPGAPLCVCLQKLPGNWAPGQIWDGCRMLLFMQKLYFAKEAGTWFMHTQRKRIHPSDGSESCTGHIVSPLSPHRGLNRQLVLSQQLLSPTVSSSNYQPTCHSCVPAGVL